MKSIQTHYSNLKVARDAPPELIRAAYKTLSQKYHPDRNLDNPDAARVMSLINAAYAVLSDPKKRQEHDKWIAQQELEASQKYNTKIFQETKTPKAQKIKGNYFGFRRVIFHFTRNFIPYGAATFFIWFIFFEEISLPKTAPKPYLKTPFTSSKNEYDDIIKNGAVNNIAQVADGNPDVEAKLQDLAKRYNLPKDAVRLQPTETEKKAKIDSLSYDEIVKNFPNTGRFLVDPSNVAIAHDDVENLTSLEKALKFEKKARLSILTWLAANFPRTVKLFTVQNKAFIAHGNVEKVSGVQYIKPNTAPNGQSWPIGAEYIKGYQKLNMNGLSSVTIDNRRNDSSVFVKIVSIDTIQAFPVRQIYIPASGQFIIEKITKGTYDVRYRNLNDGNLLRTEPFTLKEISENNAIQYSNITMTLYKTQNGNMQTYALSESEF